ncbi:hypothetical protein [Salinisphaera hydrothermalis]|nr:hypothetical protein [Salinisphaera hydrothermalis]
MSKLSKLRDYLSDRVPGMQAIEDFEIQPEIRGDRIYADLDTLRQSEVAVRKVAALKKQAVQLKGETHEPA